MRETGPHGYQSHDNRKGSDRIINRGEWNRTREDKGWIVMIRDIGSLGGLGVGSEVKGRTGLNSTPLLRLNPMRPALVGKLIKRVQISGEVGAGREGETEERKGEGEGGRVRGGSFKSSEAESNGGTR